MTSRCAWQHHTGIDYGDEDRRNVARSYEVDLSDFTR